MLCPSCAYREADHATGFCSVCTGQLSIRMDYVLPCPRCGAAERDSAGDCAPCHRRRERRNAAQRLDRAAIRYGLRADMEAVAELMAHVRHHIRRAQVAPISPDEQLAFELWEHHRDHQRWHQRDRRTA